MKRVWLLFSFVVVASAQTTPVPLPPVFVTANRASEVVDYVPFSNQTLSGETLRATANVSVDGTLRSVPGFSLFRRSDSLVANPTTQGVSLRGLGPSGASRSLVLLDGCYGAKFRANRSLESKSFQALVAPRGAMRRWAESFSFSLNR